MKLNRDWMNSRCGSLTLALCAAVTLFVVLNHIAPVIRGLIAFLGFFSPVFIGMVLAYVMDPLAVLLERILFSKVKKDKPRRVAAVVTAIVIIIALIVLLLVALIPQVVSSIFGFFNNLDSYSASLQALIGQLNGNSNASFDINDLVKNVNGMIGSLTSNLSKNFSSVIDTGFSIGSAIVNGVISFILAIYFLLAKDWLLHTFTKFVRLILPENRYNELAVFWKKCNEILIRYIVFDILDGTIIGIANCIFMLIAGIPYVALISVVVGVTNLAPTFGPIVGGVIGSAILVLVNPWYALWFIIFTLILQTCDGYVIKPILFGGTLNVPSIWILCSIIVLGRMFGVAGILLAIPFAAIVDYVMRENVVVKLKERRARIDRENAEAAASVPDESSTSEKE